MRRVWMVADSVVSPLGFSSEENYQKVRAGQTGIRLVHDARLGAAAVQVAQLQSFVVPEPHTRFERVCQQVLGNLFCAASPDAKRTLFILSTTKGNIELLESGKRHHAGIHLHQTAALLANQFGWMNHLVVSNACVSGVMALIVAKRYLENGKYDHAVVLGVDTLSRFVVSGFQSLMALSHEECKPFDAGRQGINLGEAGAAILLTTKPDELECQPSIRITGAGLSNDANHISGPSRTGEELSFAVTQALREAKLTTTDVGFISAHGTATLYNDDMEAKAFHHAGLSQVPLNSLKANFGHTLGAAGVLETVMSVHGLMNNEVLPTRGFQTPGVSKPVNINKTLQAKSLTTCVKTASGFGGCNAVIVLQKENE